MNSLLHQCRSQPRTAADVSISVIGAVALSTAFMVVLCSPVWAIDSGDGQSITINFSVLDEKNQAVADALVQIRLNRQLLASTLTDDRGKGSLTVSSPGSYFLNVSRKGYIQTESTLEVSAHTGTQEVEVILAQVALSQQNIEVRETPPNPVNEASSSQTTLNPIQAKDTPSKPATLTDALPLVPGIVRGKDGSVRVAGYGENHSALLVNSVNVTDPATGEFGLSVPIDSVEKVSVSEMPYLAQYGRFIAGVVSAETRRGGDKWQYSLNDPLPEFRIRSAHLEGLKDASPRLNLSGPMIPDRLYFLEGAEYLLHKQEVRTLPFPENETRSTAINLFTQLDAIISSTQTLTASFHFAPHSLRYAGLDFFNPQPVTPDANFHESTGTILDRLAVGNGVFESTLATTRVSTGVQPQGAADMIVTPLGNQGNYFSQQSRRATRLEWIESWASGTLHFAGHHLLQLGSVVDRSENEGQFRARPVLLQDASGHLIQRIDFTDGQPFGLSDIEPAIYLQDHWVLNGRFALDTGFRIEAQTITHTVRQAPRAGFIWTPDRSAKIMLRGGIGVFYDSVPLDVYAFNSYPEQIITTYDASGAIVGSPVQYINLTQQAAELGFPFVDRARKRGNFAPYSVAWNLELERSVSRVLMIRVKYLRSLAQDVLTIQPELIQNQPALVLGSSGATRTRQYEFTARIGSEAKRQFFFSYVRQNARGDTNDASTYIGNFPFPVVRQDLIASLPSEIPNRFLLWGTCTLPRKIRVIPHIEYRNGFPYQPTNALDQYMASSSGPQHRFPRYFSVDLRLSKDIQINRKHAIRLSASILNLTNHFNPLEVHSNVADPQYGTFFGNYPRRALLDFDFLY